MSLWLGYCIYLSLLKVLAVPKKNSLEKVSLFRGSDQELQLLSWVFQSEAFGSLLP